MTATLSKLPTRSVAPCLADPDLWAEAGDDAELRALCRSCPRRWLCAKEALAIPGVVGMVAGVYVADEGRGRAFALRRLHSLAAHAGYASQPEIP